MRKVLLSVLSLMLGVLAMAQPQKGKVYNLKNVGYDKSLSMSELLAAVAMTTNNDDLAQQWLVTSASGETFSLLNLASGMYLKGNNSTSSAWTLSSDEVTLTYTVVSGNYAIRQQGHTNGYGYMHIDASQNAVSWEPNNNNSQWTFNEISYTADELEQVLKSMEEITVSPQTVAKYQQALDALFADKACSELKAQYSGYTEAQMQADANYLALPTALQQMVLKVLTGQWEEANGDATKDPWSSERAKKYRVQLYEPYNEPEAAAKALRINAHTNLNNPTGIYSSAHSLLYVMVEGEIKEGASLYLSSYTGHGKLGGYKHGIELKSGLNVIPSYSANSSYCINYVVQTFNGNKSGKDARVRKLSDYPNLKIHIEGGHINGYYNKVGDDLYTPDKNADWEYIEQRATQTDVTILGEYITLQFPLNDADTEGNQGLSKYLNEKVKVEDVINEWDNVMLWERLLMGVVDEATVNANAKKSPYSAAPLVIDFMGSTGDAYACDYGDYYNVHGLSYGVGGSSYMYGSWDHCGYHYNTMGGVIKDLPTSAGAHWGPGHEIGHQHQGPLNMRGLTEVTNNLFSNVVLWYYGESTSRYNGSEGSLSHVLSAFNTEGSDFFTNNIWAQTHMYYKLFLYYHVLGNNPKFYPRLFEMLRQDPMTIEYEQSGVSSLLHFYKKCCLASGNDLTEFFRAHGFFRVMKNRFVGDYSNANYNMTQAEIDAAIAEVKALNYPQNLSVLFVNDGTGETIKSHKGDNLDFYGESTKCAEVGSYASFAGNAAPEYTYTMSAFTLALTGKGGVGFAVVDAKGELLAFSDMKTFTVSAQCAQLLASGQAKVMAVCADGTLTAAKDYMDTASLAEHYARLGEMLKQADALIAMIDETRKTYPGYFLPEGMTDFMKAYENAKKAYDNKDGESYSAVFDLLNQEYLKALSDKDNRVPFVPGSTYVLTSKKYPGKSIELNASGTLHAAAIDLTKATQQWVMESATEKDTYYIKSKSTGKYLGELAKSSNISANADAQSSAKAYKLYDLGNALWALQCQTEKDQMSLHCDSRSNIVGWYHTAADNDGSWWYLTATSVDEDNLMLGQLEDLVEQTQELISLVGGVAVGKTTLSTNAGSAFCLTDNNGKNEGSLENLLDGNTGTYYVSNWGDAPTQASYLQVETAETSALSKFQFSYTTRNGGGAPVPSEIVVSASEDGNSFTTLQTFTKDAHALPAASDASEWTTPVLGDGTKAYRYLRFAVTKSCRPNGGEANSNGVYHYGISEFALINSAATVKDEYASIDNALLTSAHEALQQALQVLEGANSTKQEYADAYAALLVQYEALLAAKEQADNADVAGKKQQLLNLINETKTLMESCGTVTFSTQMTETKLQLQTSDATKAGHLYCNAPFLSDPTSSDYSPVEKSYWILDNDYSTFLHTDWSSNAPDEDHFLRVYVSEEGTARFRFNYSTRGQGGTTNRGNPTQIVVEGSSEAEGEYTVIKTLASGDAENPLPTSAELKHYNSADLGDGTSYKYLRFRVTANEANEKANGHHWFYISEFGLTCNTGQSGYSVTLKDNIGNVTEELLISVYKEIQKAQMVYETATAEAQVLAAIGSLQEQYDTLMNAKYINVKVSQVALDKTEAKLIEGESLTLTATVTPHYAYNRKVSWSSSNTAVATVDANGVVKAIAPGAAVITAKAGDKSATCALTVEKKVIPVGGISLSQTSATLVEGESLTLTATVTPADATDKTVTWSSSNTAIATVDASGLVKAIAPGTAVITAKAGDKSATCTLTVEKKVIPVSGITLSHTSATLVEGESLTLSATVTPADATDKTVTWSSSNTAVATVDANGLVKAIAPGTAVITAKAGDKSATCALTVEKKVIPVGGISLSQTSATLVEGESLTLTATVTPADATDKTVTWSSSDETVATVDANGKVVAIAPGTAVITAQAGDFTATCEIVVSAIDSIEDLKALGDNVVVYDLEGRRIFDVDNLKPGLYIVNGKRVLIGKRVN